MTPPPPTASLHRHRQALLVVTLYATFAALWITLSDVLLAWWLPDSAMRARVGTLKGWVFVGVTSVLLYTVLYRWTAAPAGDPGSGATTRVVPRWATALLMGTIVGLTGLALVQRHQQARDAVERHLQATARTKADQLADWHRERAEDAVLIAQTRAIRDGWDGWRASGDAALAAELRGRLALMLQSGRYRNAGLVDGLGHALWADARDPAAADPRIREVAVRALAGALQSFAWRDADGRWQWLYAAPVEGVAQPVAVVLMVAEPERLAALQPWNPRPEDGETLALVRRDGDRVLFLDGAGTPARPPSIALDDPHHPAARLLRGDTAPDEPLTGVDRRGLRVIAVGHPVPGTDWWLVALQPGEHVLHQALQGADTTLLTALLALFATAVGVRLFDQRARLLQVSAHAAELQHIQSRLAESETRFRLLAEHGADVVWLYDLARDRFVYVSPSVQRLVGRPARDIVGRSFDDLLTPPSLARVRQRLPRRLAELAQGRQDALTETTELELRHADGRPVITETVSTLVTDAAGQAHQIQGVTRDLTARREAEAHIRRLSQAIEQSPAAVLITDAQARIEYVNPAFERISGYTLAQVRGRNPRLLSSGRVPSQTWRQAWRALRDGRSWTGEVVNRRPDGSEYLQAVTIAPVLDPHGQVTHYVSVQLDISAQRDAEAKVRQLAWFDPLTGLPNRARALEALAQALLRDRRHRRHRALLLLNVDRFKTFNEALGHASGDVLLQQLARRLQATVQPGDLLARLGGDEFALLTHAGDGGELDASRSAQRVSDAIHAALHEAFVLEKAGDGRVNITLSIGIAVLPAGTEDTPLDVLRRADTALRRAKEMGGHQSIFFDDAMGAAVARRFTVEQELRRALTADELRLYLQPQADADGHWRAAEALVRWQHPTRGLVPPAEFVPVAEGCDLIEPLGSWVLQATCAHLGRLAGAGCRLPIAVNVSPRQFHRPHFVEEVMAALQAHGAQAADLVLEVTESVVVEDIDAVVERMQALTREGVRFSIDDFGTGYSSLSYLKRLPIQEIKIDRSFVRDAPRDPDDAALVEAIIAVAERLRLQVVAEGVETAEQAAFFARWPHVLQQGYLHGRPEAAESVLERWQSSRAAGPNGIR